MDLASTYRDVLVPANGAVSALRMAGLCVSVERMHETIRQWETDIARLEAFVEGAAAEKGLVIKYSRAHALGTEALANLLYSPKGLDLPIEKTTPTGQPSTDDEALLPYASLSIPKPEDDPVVTAVLKIRSLSKGISTYLKNWERHRGGVDGRIHQHFNWTLRTARLSSDNPNTQNIPERADKDVADSIKACIVPRVNPALHPEAWDPRIHGACWRWDISGAEGAWRAACMPAIFCSKPDPIAWEYIRMGKDIHGKTASLIYDKPEGTYTKGDWERDAAGKQTFFSKIYGATWKTVQATIYMRTRIWLEDEEAKAVSQKFDKGYPGVVELYEIDKRLLGERGYCEDGYGRRRTVPIPQGCHYRNGKWSVEGATDEERKRRNGLLQHAFHVCANTPTQSVSAMDCLWMLALLKHGEYVELRVPPLLESRGVLFPEAKSWQFHEGPGPGGKPFLAWHMNTVHDSGWGDSAPGYLEPVMKTVFRRCTALPHDWRLKTDVPYRVDFSVGPDMSRLESYNKVAKRFGLEPHPE